MPSRTENGAVERNLDRAAAVSDEDPTFVTDAFASVGAGVVEREDVAVAPVGLRLAERAVLVQTDAVAVATARRARRPGPRARRRRGRGWA